MVKMSSVKNVLDLAWLDNKFKLKSWSTWCKNNIS